MRDYLKAVACAIGAVTVIAAAFLYASPPAHPAKAAPAIALSTVIVANGSGHGSGVHIGHGYIITAAHVVGQLGALGVTYSTGLNQIADVLWSNTSYDVALIRIGEFDGLATSPLACSHGANLGDDISAIGNPLSMQFVHAWGHVASDVRERARWKSSFIADMTIAPGMSGGPVLNNTGEVVGISVGLPLDADPVRNSDGEVVPGLVSVATVPFSYIVPSGAICALLARV